MSASSTIPPKTALLARNTGRRAAALLLFALLLPRFAAHAEATLVLAAPEGYPNTYIEDGQIKGFFADLVREAFHRSNRAVDIRIEPWMRSIEDARFGHADGMFVIYKNAEREAYFDFPAEPLVTLHEVVYVRNAPGAPAKFDIDQPFGHRVAIVSHSYHGPRIAAALASGRFAHVLEVDGYDTMVRMLAAGRIDVAISVADPIAESVTRLKLGDKIKRLPDIDQVPAYLVFTKVRDMSAERTLFEDGIRAMKADGTYDAIARKYRR
jgi:polar amino acid transport system substrate-binding protein